MTLAIQELRRRRLVSSDELEIFLRANSFPLVEGQPVAVMIYNNAEIMSTPWETVISLYRDASRGRSLDTVQDYAEDFMNFLSGNPDLFPADHQDTEFFKLLAVVFTVIAEDFDYQVSKFKESNGARLRDHASAIFEFVIGELHGDYQRYPDDNPRADLACFPNGMGEQVRRRYRAEIEQLVDGGWRIWRAVVNKLNPNIAPIQFEDVSP